MNRWPGVRLGDFDDRLGDRQRAAEEVDVAGPKRDQLAPAHPGLASRTALSNVDNVVNKAQGKLRAWRASYDQAVEEKRRDIDELAGYRSARTAQLDRYSGLRNSLSDWINRVENPTNFVTYDEGYDVLSRAQMDREAVRDAMNAMPVPTELSSSHNEVVSVIDDGIAAVSAAHQGTLDGQWCTYTCYYKDTPGWQKFESESARITDGFDAAVRNWRSEIDAAESATETRALPRRPVV